MLDRHVCGQHSYIWHDTLLCIFHSRGALFSATPTNPKESWHSYYASFILLIKCLYSLWVQTKVIILMMSSLVACVVFKATVKAYVLVLSRALKSVPMVEQLVLLLKENIWTTVFCENYRFLRFKIHINVQNANDVWAKNQINLLQQLHISSISKNLHFNHPLEKLLIGPFFRCFKIKAWGYFAATSCRNFGGLVFTRNRQVIRPIWKAESVRCS